MVSIGVFLGLARTIYIRFIHGMFGREITKYTVKYGVYIRFWPTLSNSFGLDPSSPWVTFRCVDARCVKRC